MTSSSRYDRRSGVGTNSIALCLTIVLASSLITGCGDDDGTACTACGPENSLVFTRADESVIQFPPSVTPYIWCGDWEPGTVEVPALHIWFKTANPEDPGWSLRAVVADIELGEPLSFPITFVWDQPEGVHMFLNDSPNELATDTEDASGTITFHKLPCPAGTTVEFSIDAVLGSELAEMPPVAVTGSFKGTMALSPWDVH